MLSSFFEDKTTETQRTSTNNFSSNAGEINILEWMYAKFKIEVLNNLGLNLGIMMFSLIIFYWSAIDGHSKREVLEIFNMNKNNAIDRFLFLNRQPIGQ